MRHVYLLLMFPLVAFAGNIDNDSSNSTETRSGRRIEQNESLQLRKGNTKRDSTGKESRATKSSDKSNSANESVVFEIGGSSLLVPLLQAVEMGGSEPRSLLERKIVDCGFLTKKHPVPIGSLFGVNMLSRYDPRPRIHASIDSGVRFGYSHQLSPFALRDPITGRGFTLDGFRATPRQQLVQGLQLYDEHPIYAELDGNLTIYRVRPVYELVQCYFTYGLVLQNAVQRIVKAEGVRVLNAADGHKTIVANADLEKLASAALSSTLGDIRLERQVIEQSNASMNGGCLLPTANGLTQGMTAWSCGALKVDPDSATAMLGGMQIVGENTFMGQRVMFAQSVSSNANSSASTSVATYKSSDDSTTRGREAVLTKGRGTVDEQNVSSSTGAKASTTASPR